MENAEIVGKFVGARLRNISSAMGICMGKATGSNGGNTSNDGSNSNKICNFYGTKGHKKAQCFKKNTKKAPAWWKEKQEKLGQPH